MRNFEHELFALAARKLGSDVQSWERKMLVVLFHEQRSGIVIVGNNDRDESIEGTLERIWPEFMRLRPKTNMTVQPLGEPILNYKHSHKCNSMPPLDDTRKTILDKLKNRIVPLDMLAAEVRLSPDGIRSSVKELKKRKLVAHRKGAGYYRLDFPPSL